MAAATSKAQIDVAISTFADAILRDEQGHRDWPMAAAEPFIASKKASEMPKLTRLRSWLSMRRRVPHPPTGSRSAEGRFDPTNYEGK